MRMRSFYRRTGSVLVLTLAILGTGCATTGDLKKMDEALKKEMAAMKVGLEAVQAANQREVMQRISVAQEEIKKNTEQLAQIEERIKGLDQTTRTVTTTSEALIRDFKMEEQLLTERLKGLSATIKALEGGQPEKE